MNYKLQRLSNGEWFGEKLFDSIAELVRYANNYHGYNLDYNRIKYHLRRYKKHYFDRQCGEWTTRLLCVEPKERSAK